MASTTNGNCYLCGFEAKKTVMKNHALKKHSEGDEPCFLLVIEGLYDPDYWLVADVALDKPLSALDTFLRKIWLECCGHLSRFSVDGRFENSIGKNRKFDEFIPGEKIFHMYDYGTSTETKITFVERTARPKQRAAVRLIARNIPPQLPCEKCGKPAKFICVKYDGNYEEILLCSDCVDEDADNEMMLPVTNSPRCGQCGYCGELDVFEYKPADGKGD
ncbi:MAG: hypothetical protein LBP62_03425 [Clostridiales bacterium]|jgi:hypothetical protein|nr:hypothetical protein [Clostridiales bacterium]